MLVGTVDDAVQQPTVALAKQRLELARLAGFDSIMVSAFWVPGQTGPDAAQLQSLGNVTAAADLSAMRVVLSVTNIGSKTTPLTETARGDFSRFAASLARTFPSIRIFVIGNEPNLNRFWLPQFNPDGGDAAAPAYEAVLARTYDSLKAVSPRLTVVGGSVSPRGEDDPRSKRQTHSPTTFVRDLGLAYRASKRKRPIMDEFAFHPYQDNSSVPPGVRHKSPRSLSIADYARLVRVLGQAFDGTAQTGSLLPILYSEFGVESATPAAKLRLYTGSEPPATKPVPETTQAAYYRQAVQLAFCQPTVRGILLFHALDEPMREGWQSGLFYADGTPKAGVSTVRAAARASRGGVVARCPGLELTPHTRGLVFPRGAALRAPRLGLRFACDLDCTYEARLERLPSHATVLTRRGRGLAGIVLRPLFPPRRLTPGRYRFTLLLSAPVNSGWPSFRASGSLRIS